MRPLCQCGEIGRHAGFKIRFLRGSGGSTPPTGTTSFFLTFRQFLFHIMKDQTRYIIQVEHAGLFRRLAALVYDLFLVVAIWFAIAGIGVSLNGGEAMPSWINHYLLFPALIISTFVFYFWFWTHGGQTLGMRAWRLKLLNDQKQTPSFSQCLKRFAIAVLSLGLGFLLAPFHPQKKSLQDWISETQVVLLPK